MHKPTILQIIPELGAGGAEQGCIDIAEALVRGEARSIVMSHGGHRIQELKRLGAKHIDAPVHAKNPITILRNAARIEELIKSEQIDLVHVRSRAPAWSAWRACRKTNTPFVTTCHAPYNFKGELKKKYNSIMARGDRVIAISHFVADYLRQNFQLEDERLRIIPRGIALEKFHPKMMGPKKMIDLINLWRIPDEARVVLMPGRLTRWKGHHTLIEAMSLLREEDVFCVIIGADQGRKEYREELESTIEEKGLGGNFRIVDHCEDMPSAYMMSTVVVSASIEPEGFGRIPVESQAMGCPVIATDHGGARETVFPGETGWLVEPGNANAMAQALKEALALPPHQRALMATKGMANVARNFSREIMMERTLDVYAELLSQKQEAARRDLKAA
jgi:glycosyltransferase involved in cell wall biosynthesis